MKKHIPTFKSEAEERRFWQTHDSTEYVDWSEAEEVLMPKLRPTTRSIPDTLNRLTSSTTACLSARKRFG
jgi:hypothetical protein